MPQSPQTLAASLIPPINPSLPPSFKSSSFSSLNPSDLATEHPTFCSDGTPEDLENTINSDPDPGCLDTDPSSQDTNSGATQPEDLSTWLGFQSLFENTQLEDLLTTVKFIQALQLASHNDVHCKMEQSAIQRLRNPPTTPFDVTLLPDPHLGIDLFLANINSPFDSFNANQNAILQRHPEDNVPSYSQMICHISKITGVSSVIHTMCKNSWLAFTGPFANLDRCSVCNEPKLCPVTSV